MSFLGCTLRGRTRYQPQPYPLGDDGCNICSCQKPGRVKRQSITFDTLRIEEQQMDTKNTHKLRDLLEDVTEIELRTTQVY